MPALDDESREPHSWSTARQAVAHLRRRALFRGRGAVYLVHQAHCPPGDGCDCTPRMVVVRPRVVR